MRLTVALLVAATTTASASEVDLPAANRVGLELTIYANGLAVVHDRRRATLVAGSNRLAFPDVSRQMIPESAIVSGDELTVNIIDYDFATLSPDALVRRHVGREVGVVRVNPTTAEETVERATILSADPGIVLRYRDRIETGVPGRLIFDAVPEDLRPTPTLLATASTPTRLGEGDVALTYLTLGLAWQADYVAVLDEAAARIDLDGRAIVRNTSGSSFKNADLAFVAGEIRRVSAVPQPGARKEMMTMAAAAPPAAAPVGLGAAYLYRLPEPVDLADRQSRQFTLLHNAGLPVEQRYISESSQAIIASRGESRSTHPTVSVRFTNPPTDAGGMPLPTGVVRVYAAVNGGGLHLLGEDAYRRYGSRCQRCA